MIQVLYHSVKGTRKNKSLSALFVNEKMERVYEKEEQCAQMSKVGNSCKYRLKGPGKRILH